MKQKSIALIDYLKFEVLYDFDDKEHLKETEELFRLLILDINQFVEAPGMDGFEHRRTYDENTYLYYSPGSSINNKLGCESFFVIELSGSACRLFELRGGSWKDLFEYFLKIPFELKRVDIAKDDINGIVDFDDLKEHIRKQHFVSSFRTTKKEIPPELKKIGYMWDFKFDKNLINPIAEDIDEIDFLNSYKEIDKTGFTAKFGNKGSKLEFEIYDKKVERLVNGCPSPLGQWLRFEMRYFHDKAQGVLPYLVEAFKSNHLDELASNLLFGMMDFKDVGDEKYRTHYGRYPTCKWWVDFLGSEAEKLKVAYPTKLDTTLDRSIRWIYTGVMKTLMQVYATDCTGANLSYILQKGFALKLKEGKFTNVEASKVNNYLRSRGLDIQTKTHEEMLNALMLFASEELQADGVNHKEIIEKNIKRHKEPFKVKKVETVEPEFKDDIIDPELKIIFLQSSKFKRIYDNDLRELTFPGQCPFELKDDILIQDINSSTFSWQCRITDIDQDNFRYKIIFEVAGLD